MKTSLHRILTEDKIELVGLLYEPEEKTSKILVHVHGMAGNFYENSFLDFIAKTLTDAGVAFATFNNRGTEYIKDLVKNENGRKKLVTIGNAFEKFEDCVIDIKAQIDFVEQKGFSEIHLSGHSLAGPKTIFYTSQTQDPRLKSLILLSPADMVGLVRAEKNYVEDLALAETMIKEGKGDELIPRKVWWECYLSANAFKSLGDESSPVALLNLYNPADKLSALGKVTIPTFTVMGKKDSALTVPIEELMKRIAEALTSSPKIETKILGDANHGFDSYEQQLADAMRDWLLNI